VVYKSTVHLFVQFFPLLILSVGTWIFGKEPTVGLFLLIVISILLLLNLYLLFKKKLGALICLHEDRLIKDFNPEHSETKLNTVHFKDVIKFEVNGSRIIFNLAGAPDFIVSVAKLSKTDKQFVISSIKAKIGNLRQSINT